MKDFYNVDEKTDYILHILRCKSTLLRVRLGRVNFWAGVSAQRRQSSRREASTWTFLDRLDIFSDAIDRKNDNGAIYSAAYPLLGGRNQSYRKCNRNRYRSSFTAQVADCSELAPDQQLVFLAV